MKKFISISLFFASFACFVNAQTGNTCGYAILLPSGNSCVSNSQTAGNELWYYFKADSSVEKITVDQGDTTGARVASLSLFEGTCSSPTLLGYDTIVDVFDTLLEVGSNYLVKGNFYLVRLIVRGYATPSPSASFTSYFSVCKSSQSANTPYCGFDQWWANALQNDPGAQAKHDALSQTISNYIKNNPMPTSTTYMIPVVVHVIHPNDPYGTGYNISYAQILSQIAALNAAFGKAYPSYNQQGYYTPDYAVNTQIQFCLATIPAGIDINNQPVAWSNTNEPGVMRYSIPPNDPNYGVHEHDMNTEQPLLLSITHPNNTYFPFNQYLNVWTVADICSGTSCNQILDMVPSVVAYATLPVANPTFDGIVSRSDCFGDNTVVGNNFNLFPFLDQGKIMSHEAGHYFDLFHTHHPNLPPANLNTTCSGTDAPNGPDPCDGSVNGDRICDTPPCIITWSTNFPPQNTCTETYSGNLPDQIENFMSYSDDNIMNTFSQGQANWMQAILLNTNLPRYNLWQSANLTATGVLNGNACAACIFTANFTYAPQTICPGQPVNFFTPSGMGFCATTWTWSFPGGSITQDFTPIPPAVTYGAAGTYTVTLVASDGTNTLTQQAVITVAYPTTQIIAQSTTGTVCDQSNQSITIQFTGTGPFSFNICNNNNIVVASFTNITANPVTVTVPVTLTSNSFTVCNAQNAFCNATSTGTATFTVSPCCPNLFANGDFSAGTGCNITPSTTQQLPPTNYNPPCGFYNPQYYGVVNPSIGYGGWGPIPGFPGVNGNSMAIDGWPFSNPNNPIFTNTPANQTEIWCQTVPVGNGTTYAFKFDCSGNFAVMNTAQPASSNQTITSLLLQLKVNGVLIGTPIYIPPYNSNTPWVTYTVNWTSNINSPGVSVCLCQVGSPNNVNFGVGSFDYLVDNFSFRGIGSVAANAGPDLTICIGDQVQIGSSNVSGVTYSWAPATGLSNSTISNPVASPTATTTYSLYTSDVSGCTASDMVIITVNPICCTAAYYTPSTLSNVLLTPPGVPSIAINQNLTINGGTVTFDNEDVKIGTGVTITVLSGCTLVITNQSHLYACSQMWQGIDVQPGGLLIVNGNSLIEDAKSAVRSFGGGEYRLNTAIFNKNLIDVDVLAFAGTHQGFIRNSVFTCRLLPPAPTVAQLTPSNLTSLAPVNLIAPFQNRRTFAGVNIVDVGNILIGLAQAGNSNTFDFMDFGNKISNSDVIIRNNVFQNIRGNFTACPFPGPCPPQRGQAIYSEDPSFNISNSATYNTIIIGGTGLQVNTFTDCRRSIYNSNYVTINIRGNTFNSSTTRWWPQFNSNLNGESGIHIANVYSQQLDVVSNTMTNQYTGIHVIRTGGGLPQATSINLSSNTLSAGTASTVFMNVGIFAEDIISTGFLPGNFYNINNNTVTRANTCIWAKKIDEGGLRIISNPSLFIRPTTTSSTPGPNKAGIKVESCNRPLIANNPMTFSTGTNYSVAVNRNVRGIYIIKTFAPDVICNYVLNTGQSIVFEGFCINTRFRLNSMQNAYDGFVLRNNAVISQQGSSTVPIKDSWVGGFVFSQTFTDNTINANTNSPIWVNPGVFTNPTNNQTNMGPGNQITPNLCFVTNLLTCPVIGGGGGGGGNFADNTTRLEIVQDQIPLNSLIQETQRLGKQGVFSDLAYDPSLMLNDQILQQFYNANQTTNIGKINLIPSLINNGNTGSAVSTNNSINPTSTIEDNHQQLNSIYLSTLGVGSTDFTQQQVDDLFLIANQCPLAGGDAVLQARSTLNLIYHTSLDFIDSCESESNIRYAFDENGEGTVNVDDHVDLFPNPNDGTMTLKYDVPVMESGAFVIYDITGRKMAEYPLKLNVNAITVTEKTLPDGVYLYKVIVDDAIIATGKLVIAK